MLTPVWRNDVSACDECDELFHGKWR